MDNFPKAPDLLHRFLTDCRINKNQSPATVREYYLDLMMFFKYIVMSENPKLTNLTQVNPLDIKEQHILNVTSQQVSDFMVYLSVERKVKPATQSRKLSAIKSLYHYLFLQLKLIDEDPTLTVSKPKVESRLPVYLTIEESNALLDVCEKEGMFKERNYLMVVLFLNLGLRLAELVGIDLTDIKDNNLTITGKGNKSRMIPLNETCLLALKEYYPKRIKPRNIADKNALFVSRQKNRISRREVQFIIEKSLNAAGLDRKYSTHKLRHTAATLMYQTGEVEVLALKKILGHELVSSTEIYTHVADRQVKDALDINPMNIKRKSEE